jgi:hypothetical protein
MEFCCIASKSLWISQAPKRVPPSVMRRLLQRDDGVTNFDFGTASSVPIMGSKGIGVRLMTKGSVRALRRNTWALPAQLTFRQNATSEWSYLDTTTL